MIRFIYLIRKFIGNVIGRPLPTVTSLLSLLLLFFMLDMVWVASLSINNYFDRITGTIEMELFLDEETTDSTMVPILDAINNLGGVENLRYISKEQAREKLYSLMGIDLLDGLDVNPLPISIIISFKDEYLNSDFLTRFENHLLNLPHTAEVFYPKDWLEEAEFTKDLIYKGALFLGGLIYLAVILNLLYAMRLSSKTREEELYQFRLLGASRSFLSFPFVLEGIFYAFAASVGGWLIIYYLSDYITLSGLEILLPARKDIFNYCLVAFGTGMLSGYIGLRRSL